MLCAQRSRAAGATGEEPRAVSRLPGCASRWSRPRFRYPPPFTKRPATSADELPHLEWMCKLRCQGESIVDIAAGISAATQAISIARTLRDVERSYDAVALKGQIIDLMNKLQEVRGALQDAREELDAQREEIGRLQSAFEQRAETVMYAGYRYTADPEDKTKPVGRPFCQRCETVDGRLILCTESPQGRRAACPQCKTVFADARIFLWPERRPVPQDRAVRP